MECTAISIAPASQGLLDLLGEKSLAADLAQGPVADTIAGRSDRHDFDAARIESAGRREPVPDFTRLNERQFRAAASDAQERGLHGGYRECFKGERAASIALAHLEAGVI